MVTRNQSRSLHFLWENLILMMVVNRLIVSDISDASPIVRLILVGIKSQSREHI
jgi:hypothetical protein